MKATWKRHSIRFQPFYPESSSSRLWNCRVISNCASRSGTSGCFTNCAICPSTGSRSRAPMAQQRSERSHTRAVHRSLGILLLRACGHMRHAAAAHMTCGSEGLRLLFVAPSPLRHVPGQHLEYGPCLPAVRPTAIGGEWRCRIHRSEL